jgi:hypothetical protein
LEFLSDDRDAIVRVHGVARCSPGASKGSAKPNKDALSEAEKEGRLAAEKLVSGIEVEVFSDDKWVKVKRIEKPLFYFGDDTRGDLVIFGGQVEPHGKAETCLAVFGRTISARGAAPGI